MCSFHSSTWWKFHGEMNTSHYPADNFSMASSGQSLGMAVLPKKYGSWGLSLSGSNFCFFSFVGPEHLKDEKAQNTEFLSFDSDIADLIRLFSRNIVNTTLINCHWDVFLEGIPLSQNAKAHLFILHPTQLFHIMFYRKMLEHNIVECKYLLSQNSWSPNQQITLSSSWSKLKQFWAGRERTDPLRRVTF